MSAVQDAMDNLTKQWYNALVNGLHLSSNNFQLYQGGTTTGNESEWIWNILDAVPPKGINNFYNPSQNNNFSQDYQAVIANLQPSSDNSFQNCMGDYYDAWQKYVASSDAPSDIMDSADAMSSAFKKWAFVHAPSQMNCSSSLVSSYFNDTVTIANNMFSAAQTSKKAYAYTITIEDLKNNLASAPSRSFSLDTKTASTDISHTWAEGSTSVFFDFFSFGGGTNYDSLSEKTTSSGLTIDVKFDSVATITAGPLAKPSSDPILQNYTPWYDSAALARAYGTKDNTIWKHGSPSWETTFGENGNMQYITTSLVIVDGIYVSTTTEANYTSSEQTTITGEASSGFWPFFSASGSGGSETKATFDSDGKMTAKTTSPKGNPQVIGVLVSTTKEFLG